MSSNGGSIAFAPISYDPGYIVLSYFTSLVGCVTTLELLNRRTSVRGLYNWFLLIAAAVTAGGPAIFCMHFIGNRAINLEYGDPNRQLYYSPGFTALSFFLPIVVLLLAFYIIGSAQYAKTRYIIMSGVLTGTAVCGMHYVGQLGIANYYVTYDTKFVAGAAVIAVAASTVALTVFFRLREAWSDAWWKRVLCGAILACAVSGMHWTATVGTSYQYKGLEATTNEYSRAQTVILCAVLSFMSCLVLLIVAFIRGHRLRLERIRSRQLVLACAYYDEGGKLMVTPEGAVPGRIITDRFVEKNFGEDELNRGHPTFAWIYRASRDWRTIHPLIPTFMEKAKYDQMLQRYLPGGKGAKEKDGVEPNNFSFIFKELFCLAAHSLSGDLQQPLENLGTLFEDPMNTNVRKYPTSIKFQKDDPKESMVTIRRDEENLSDNSSYAGSGKYLFLVRQLDRQDELRFGSLGYRFATIEQVSTHLSRQMKVDQKGLAARLQRMHVSASYGQLPPAGVHLACFVLRPTVQRKFEVLVPFKSQNQLPLTLLQERKLSAWQVALLRKYDECPVKDVLKELVAATDQTTSEAERTFVWSLHSALFKLIQLTGMSNAMMDAKFSAKSVELPCQTGKDDASDTCTIFSIRKICALHSAAPGKGLVYVPLTFFTAQQALNPGVIAGELQNDSGRLSGNPSSADGASELRAGAPTPDTLVTSANGAAGRKYSSQDTRPKSVATVHTVLSIEKEMSEETTPVLPTKHDEDGADPWRLRGNRVSATSSVRRLDDQKWIGYAAEVLTLQEEGSWVSDIFKLFKIAT